MMDRQTRSPNGEPRVPMYIYAPKNSRRLIYWGQLRRRLDWHALYLLAVSLAFVTGVIIGALFF